MSDFFHNYLSNGAFNLATRGVGPYSLALPDDQGPDYWRATWEEVAPYTGRIEYSRRDGRADSAGSRYYGRFCRTAESGKFALYNTMRQGTHLKDRIASVGFRMRASSGMALKIGIFQFNALDAGTAEYPPSPLVRSGPPFPFWLDAKTDPVWYFGGIGFVPYLQCGAVYAPITPQWQDVGLTANMTGAYSQWAVVIWTDEQVPQTTLDITRGWACIEARPVSWQEIPKGLEIARAAHEAEL